MQRPRARERQVGPSFLKPVVLLAVVRDVLADALLAGAVKVDDRRLAEEVRARLQRQQLELVSLDGEREVADCVVQAHRPANATDTSPASRAFADRERAVHLARAPARALVESGEHERGHAPGRRHPGAPLRRRPPRSALRPRCSPAAGSSGAARRRRAASAPPRCAPRIRRRRRAARRAALRSRSRRAASCPSGSRERGSRASPGAPSSPGCRGATSPPSRRRAPVTSTSATRSAETSGGVG